MAKVLYYQLPLNFHDFFYISIIPKVQKDRKTNSGNLQTLFIKISRLMVCKSYKWINKSECVNILYIVSVILLGVSLMWCLHVDTWSLVMKTAEKIFY